MSVFQERCLLWRVNNLNLHLPLWKRGSTTLTTLGPCSNTCRRLLVIPGLEPVLDVLVPSVGIQPCWRVSGHTTASQQGSWFWNFYPHRNNLPRVKVAGVMVWGCSMASRPGGSCPVVCRWLQVYLFSAAEQWSKTHQLVHLWMASAKPNEDFGVVNEKVLGTIKIFSGKIDRGLGVPA